MTVPGCCPSTMAGSCELEKEMLCLCRQDHDSFTVISLSLAFPQQLSCHGDDHRLHPVYNEGFSRRWERAARRACWQPGPRLGMLGLPKSSTCSFFILLKSSFAFFLSIISVTSGYQTHRISVNLNFPHWNCYFFGVYPLSRTHMVGFHALPQAF